MIPDGSAREKKLAAPGPKVKHNSNRPLNRNYIKQRAGDWKQRLIQSNVQDTYWLKTAGVLQK